MLRRNFLGSLVVASTWSRGAFASQDVAPPKDDSSDADKVIERCREVGLTKAEIARGAGKLFVAAGDAPEAFRQGALKICESMARSFLEHFKAKGFELALPKTRLTIVTLAGLKSFEAFVGEPANGSGGHYDLEQNRLVMFDFRAGDDPILARAEATNRLTLIHETMHQLCYNSGLLSRDADVPIALSEGFATYAEPWNSSTRKGFGAKNLGRMQGLNQGLREAKGWLAIHDLIVDDRSFDDGPTRLLAYSESWLLIRAMMMEDEKRSKLRAYLRATNLEPDLGKRAALFEEHLGGFDAIDRTLKKAAGLRG